MTAHEELVKRLAAVLCDAAGEPDYVACSFEEDARAALQVVYDTLKPLTSVSGGRSLSLDSALEQFLKAP